MGRKTKKKKKTQYWVLWNTWPTGDGCRFVSWVGDWPESDNAPNYVRSGVGSEIGVRSVCACGCSIFLTEKKQVETGAVKGNQPSTQQEEKTIEKMGWGRGDLFSAPGGSSMAASVSSKKKEWRGQILSGSEEAINKDLNRTLCRAAKLEYDSQFLPFKHLNVPIGVFIFKWVWSFWVNRRLLMLYQVLKTAWCVPVRAKRAWSHASFVA